MEDENYKYSRKHLGLFGALDFMEEGMEELTAGKNKKKVDKDS
jgi:hypothetical protein